MRGIRLRLPSLGPIVLVLLSLVRTAPASAEPPADGDSASPVASAPTLTLKQCLETAFKESHRRPASQFAVAMAEAQHREALADIGRR